ncbi:MAG: GAF domain-containing protein [Actinomycetota bacterium]
MTDVRMWVGLVVGAALAGVLSAAAVYLAARRAERRLADLMRSASSIVSSALAAADSIKALEGLAERLARLFEADACAVVVPDARGRLIAEAVYGFPEDKDLSLDPSEGFVGQSYTSGEPLVIEDVRKDPRYVEWIPGIRSIISVPLRFKDRVFGAFVMESRKRRFRRRDLAVVQPLADQIAAVLETLDLRMGAEDRAEEQTRLRNELQAISAVVMAGVASSSDLDAALHSMIKEISARMGWESLAVVLYGDDGLLYTRAYYGYPLHSTVVAFSPGEGVIGTVAEEGVGRLIGDVSKDPDYLDIVTETRSEMCVPLFSGRRVIGVLNAESPRLDAFTEADFRMLSNLGRQMAIVIERTRLADLERTALDRLRQADQLKDDFIATVSHELRTPLTSIKGFAQTLLSRGEMLTPEERSEFLEVMVRHCDRLARIVDTLLLVSRMEAGEIGAKPAYMSVVEALRDASEASGAAERITIEAEHGIGIVTDQFRLHHILRNLLENACKYSPSRSPVLVRAQMSRHGELIVETLDQGEGIPPGMEEHIFDRFRRVADPGRSGVPGTGLGLYISLRFAQDLGGDLTVGRGEEEPWTGARFVLRLPTESALSG